MKLVLVLATIAWVQAGRLDRDYLPPKARPSGHGNFLKTPQHTLNRSQAQTHSSAPDNANDGETYSYAYGTENGIFAEEKGVVTNGVQVQGSYSYTGDDGKLYSLRYTADENGFVPQGNHFSPPHPIPKAILKTLEQNARDKAAGIFDDGSYNEVKYSGISQQKYFNTDAQPINYSRKSPLIKDYLPPRRQRNLRRNGY